MIYLRVFLALMLTPAAPAIIMFMYGLSYSFDEEAWVFWMFLIAGYVALIFIATPLYGLFCLLGFSVNKIFTSILGGISGSIVGFSIMLPQTPMWGGAGSASLPFTSLYWLLGGAMGFFSGLLFWFIAFGPKTSRFRVEE